MKSCAGLKRTTYPFESISSRLYSMLMPDMHHYQQQGGELTFVLAICADFTWVVMKDPLIGPMHTFCPTIALPAFANPDTTTPMPFRLNTSSTKNSKVRSNLLLMTAPFCERTNETIEEVKTITCYTRNRNDRRDGMHLIFHNGNIECLPDVVSFHLHIGRAEDFIHFVLG